MCTQHFSVSFAVRRWLLYKGTEIQTVMQAARIPDKIFLTVSIWARQASGK